MTSYEEGAPPLEPAVAGMFPMANPWLLGPESLRERIFKVLRPFALMYRIDLDPTELACVRGAASDMTVLTSQDFSEAFDLLLDLGDGDFAEEVSEDSRYTGG